MIGVTRLDFQIVLWSELIIYYIGSKPTTQFKNGGIETHHLRYRGTPIIKTCLITSPLISVKCSHLRYPINPCVGWGKVKVIKHVLGKLRVLLGKNLRRQTH